jgi:catechol 2,3-dioxygenase-like lactoylglutathione lyase family enzyme
MNRARLANVAPVLPTPDVRRTAAYYRDFLGFKVVEHYDAEEAFATLYRDSVELILVQARHGDVQSNTVRYGAGLDLYIDPDTVAAVDSMYEEVKAKGVKLLGEPAMTAYGSYEFVVEDVDGRLIGIGRVSDRDTFFHGAFD